MTIKTIINSGMLEIIFIYLAFAIPFFIYLKHLNAKKKEKFKAISEIIIKGFYNGTINGYQDIENIYKSQFLNNVVHNEDMLKILCLSAKHFYTSEIEKNTFIIEKINLLINEVRKKEPFSELPQSEKFVLNSLLTFKEKLKSEEENYISKLHDLAHIIKVKYDDNNQLLKKNSRHTKFSYLIGILGIIISIYFAWAKQ
ncbi:hypothetical protein [Arcobacter sp.]|uniref:hypothetical protein n=1 Tax=Arcobacter sp. TaxID=1872629 RepID=UPI003C7909D3